MNMNSTRASVFERGKASPLNVNVHGTDCSSVCPRCGKSCSRPVCAYPGSALTIPATPPAPAFISGSTLTPSLLPSKTPTSSPSAIVPASPAVDQPSAGDVTGPSLPDPVSPDWGISPLPVSPSSRKATCLIPISPPPRKETDLTPPAKPQEEAAAKLPAPEAAPDTAAYIAAKMQPKIHIPLAPVSLKRDTASEPLCPDAETADTTECESAPEASPERQRHSCTQEQRPPCEDGLYGRGLLYFKPWWKFRTVAVAVHGTLLSGVPAFIEKNTLRIINEEYSYFVPLEKVDYIRTNDGLESSFRRKPY